MMDQFCGSARANAEKAHWILEETHEDSNGRSITAKKRRERHNIAPLNMRIESWAALSHGLNISSFDIFPT